MKPQLHELVRGLAELTRTESRRDGLAEAVLAIGRASAPAVAGVLWRRVGGDLVVEAAHGQPSPAARRWARAVAQGADGRSIADGDVTWHLAPVRSGQRAWGVIALATEADDGDLSGDDAVDGLDIACVLAGWFAGVLDHHRADRRLREVLGEIERMAHTDPLTHVLHRRAVERVLEEATVPHAAILVDIDAFGALNDTHGYSVGDAVLSHTATVLKRAIRPEDEVGRVGGDSFMVLLEGADQSSAHLVAERLREELAHAQLDLPDGATLRWTATFEVCPAEECTVDDLLARVSPGRAPRRDPATPSGDLAGPLGWP